MNCKFTKICVAVLAAATVWSCSEAPIGCIEFDLPNTYVTVYLKNNSSHDIFIEWDWKVINDNYAPEDSFLPAGENLGAINYINPTPSSIGIDCSDEPSKMFPYHMGNVVVHFDDDIIHIFKSSETEPDSYSLRNYENYEYLRLKEFHGLFIYTFTDEDYEYALAHQNADDTDEQGPNQEQEQE